MKNKTLITAAAIAVLVTSGFQVGQSLYSGGFENLNTIAVGTFVAGLVALIQRYRGKKNLKIVNVSHTDLDGVKITKTFEMSNEQYLEVLAIKMDEKND